MWYRCLPSHPRDDWHLFSDLVDLYVVRRSIAVDVLHHIPANQQLLIVEDKEWLDVCLDIQIITSTKAVILHHFPALFCRFSGIERDWVLKVKGLIEGEQHEYF